MGLGTLLLMVAVLLLSVLVTGEVYAQTPFESEEDGFRLQVPEGWVIQDDNMPPPSEEELGHNEAIAILCQESEALPGIGGDYNCLAPANRTYEISIERWPDLQSRPEFENITNNNNITTTDLLALRIQWLQNNASVYGIRIQNSTDVDEFTKLVNMTYTHQVPVNIFLPPADVHRKSSQMYVLSQDRDTGYVIYNNLNNTRTQQHSPAVQEVFNSFELVTPPTTSPPRAATTPTTPSLPQQQEVQQPQNQEAPVSIVPGSSSLTTDAYAPNPIQVSIGGTVTWTNDDAQPHTATSGDPVTVTPDGRFDSGIMAPAATFDFTFTEAGEYPYFCLLHPNMVGTVNVS